MKILKVIKMYNTKNIMKQNSKKEQNKTIYKLNKEETVLQMHKNSEVQKYSV